LPDRRGNSLPILRPLSDLTGDLVLRGLQDYFRRCHNEISDLDPDLVLREIPGNFLQTAVHPQRWRAPRTLIAQIRGLLVLSLTRRLKAGAEPPFPEIVGIALPPRGLRLPPELQTAFAAASALARPYATIRPKPPMTDAARSSLPHPR
jgi:hypothetical protein